MDKFNTLFLYTAETVAAKYKEVEQLAEGLTLLASNTGEDLIVGFMEWIPHGFYTIPSKFHVIAVYNRRCTHASEAYIISPIHQQVTCSC